MDSAVLGIVDELLRHADRSRLGEFDGLPDRGRVLEHHVDFLEVAAHGLGEEEVDTQRNHGSDTGEDDVELSTDGIDSNRGDHDDHEVPRQKSVRDI